MSSDSSGSREQLIAPTLQSSRPTAKGGQEQQWPEAATDLTGGVCYKMDSAILIAVEINASAAIWT
jgi:hypothetical protein